MAEDDFKINNKFLERLKVNSLRDIQKITICKMMTSNNDLVSVMPTGSGKTLCFQYYSLASENVMIVVYPLVSLINDQQKRFSNAKISCCVLKGGQTKSQRKNEFEKIINKEANVIITNPETLTQKSVLSTLLRFTKITLVIDECHTIIEWGKTFRSAMLKLKDIISILNIAKIFCFTATLSIEVEAGLKEYIFNERNYEKLYFSADRENIEYHYLVTNCKSHSLLNLVSDIPKPCIIFANNRLLCQNICKFLKGFYPNFDIRFYHAGKTKGERKETEEWFYNSDNGILVATCAFGMGVDKSNIRSIIHYILPSNVSGFLQESGRAGRDGKRSFSYSLIDTNEIEKTKNKNKKILINCFIDGKCIRKNLLFALGEDLNENKKCTGCSKCLNINSNNKYDKFIKLLLHDYGKLFDKNELVLLLKGVRLKKFPHSCHLPFFGILKDIHIGFIAQYIRSNLKTDSTFSLWLQNLINLNIKN